MEEITLSNKESIKLLDSTNAKLDRLVLYDFTVIDIEDVDRLVEADVVVVKKGCKNYIVLDSGEKIASIYIPANDLFLKFQYSVTKSGIKRSTLELTVDYDLYHNLNCFSVGQYKSKLETIENFLKCQYGIVIDFSLAKVKYIEINKTIMLDKNFEAYHRAISMFMTSFPDRLRLDNNPTWKKYEVIGEGIKKEKYTTYARSSGKKGLEVIVYDKTEQLKEEYGITGLEEQYLRIEIKLKSSTEVLKELETVFWSAFTDEMINEYFCGFIKMNVLDWFEKNKIARQKALKKIFSQQSGSINNRTRDLLTDLMIKEFGEHWTPVLVDITELNPVLDKLYPENKDKRYKIRKAFEKHCAGKYYMYSGTASLFEEIINKVK